MKISHEIIAMICCLICGIIPVASFSQWQWQNPLPQGNTLHSVTFVDQNHGWAVGAGGTIIYSSDGGNTWQIQSSVSLADLSGICFTDLDNGWTVGGGIILHTLDGGDTWEEQESTTWIPLRSVSFTDPDNGWIAGGNMSYYGEGIILHTSNGGTVWETQPTSLFHQYTGIHFTDPAHGWAVGCQQWGTGIIDRTTDGGITWEELGLFGTTLTSVYFTDPDNGWSVGTNGSSKIRHTDDGGNTWIDQTSWINLNNIYFTDSNNGWAVGPYGRFLSTNNGGITWNEQTIGIINNPMCISFADTLSGWIVGEGGIILHSDNGGNVWEKETKGCGLELFDICFPLPVSDPDHGWVVGRNGTIMNTANGGDSWEEQVSNVDIALQGVHFVDLSNGWAVGNSGVILHTADGGITWEEQLSPTTKTLKSVCFSDLNNGWAVGYEGTVVHTNNAGNNWELIDCGTALHLTCVCSVGPDCWIIGDDGIILHSPDQGITWQQQASGTSNDLINASFTDSLTGWIAVKQDTLFAPLDTAFFLHTSDGGVSWVKQPIPLNSFERIDLKHVSFTDQFHGYAVGTGDNAWLGWPFYGVVLLYTSNGGGSWDYQTLPIDNQLNGIFFTDPDHGWIIGEHGTIMHTDNGVISGSDIPCTSKSGLHMTSCPNPVTDVALIRYQTPADGFVIINVYDMRGKMIRELVHKEQTHGEYQVLFDGSVLPAGIYFVRLQAGSGSVTRKIVKF